MMSTAQRRTCGECARFRVPDSGCTYTKDIREGVMIASDTACHDFYPKPKEQTSKKKVKPLHKASGSADEGYFEAVYHEGKPAFCVASESGLQVMETVTNSGKTFHPLEVGEFPYIPYGFASQQVGTKEDLFWKVRDEFHFFVDVEETWKDYFASCVLLSYQQEKLHTCPYVWIYGDNDSGKSVILDLFSHLAYRPLYGACLNVADLYGYLGDMDETGVILEDEAQGLSSRREMDKQKIYKIGYKRGAKVPRYRDINGKSKLVYFPAFCFKAVASEKLPRNKGLTERFVPVQMTIGYPEKDWADLSTEDVQRFCATRNLLLKWRLLTRNTTLPNVSLPVKGRVKELWKPVFQVVEGLTVKANLYNFLEELYIKHLDDLRNTLEGNIIKVVGELVAQKEQPIRFQTIWDELLLEVNGTLDEKNPHKMQTPEFDTVTKSKVGYRLREVLDGTKTVKRINIGDESVLQKCYSFDTDKLRRILKKYGFKEIVTKLPTLSHLRGVRTPNSTLKNDVEKHVDAPSKLGKLSNSVTNIDIQTVLSIPALDLVARGNCPICKKRDVSLVWQVQFLDGSRYDAVCMDCGVYLQEELRKRDKV